MKSPTIILRTSKYADEKLIVEAFTSACGAMSFMVRVSRGRRQGTVSHTLFQPLALLEIEWDEHQRATLLKPTAAHPLLMPHSLYADPVRSALAMFLAEFLRAVLRGEPPSPQLYDYCAHAIQWLNAAEDYPVANFHLAFTIGLSRLLGINPSEEEVQLYCPQAYIHAAPQLMRMTLANQHLYHFTRAERAEFLRLILLYYRNHQTSFPELKSVEVLTEMFNS